MRNFTIRNQHPIHVGGSYSKYGIAVGDTDNDGIDEIILGSLQGNVLIFKNMESTPHFSLRDLGHINIVTIAKMSSEKLGIAIFSVDGLVYLYSSDERKSSQFLNSKQFYVRLAKQKLKLNPKQAIFHIAETDKRLKLILLHGDRKVSIFSVENYHFYKVTSLIFPIKMFSISLHLFPNGIVAGFLESDQFVDLSDHVGRTRRGSSYSVPESELKLINLPACESRKNFLSQICVLGNIFRGESRQLACMTSSGRFYFLENNSVVQTLDLPPLVLDLQKMQTLSNCHNITKNSSDVFTCTRDGIFCVVGADGSVSCSNLRNQVQTFLVGRFKLRRTGGVRSPTLLNVGNDGYLHVATDFMEGYSVSGRNGSVYSAVMRNERIRDLVEKCWD